jgi:TetR/AcrR family fatty acid metabolism transcriptional regulator
LNEHSFIMKPKNDRKAQIIEAAIKIFAHKGFYYTKVADVAREAGIADGTIYLYFKNKDDILISLFETKMEQFLKRFNAVLNEKVDSKTKLELFIDIYIQLIEENQNVAEVFQVELRQSSKFLKDYHNQKFIDFLNIIGQIIKEGQQKNEFRKDFRVNTMKIAIFGALDELARQWILSNDPTFDLREASQEVTRTFIAGLLQVKTGDV